jgi:trans-aconitate methyltransferase
VTFIGQQFGRPRGLIGRLVGQMMARSNAAFNTWLVQQIGELSATDLSRIAELGPGPGIALQELLRIFPAAQIWGIDRSPEMLAQSRKRNLEVVKSGSLTLIEGDESTLISLSPLDLVVAVHVLYFWHAPAVELSLIHDALRPQGYLALGYQLRQNMPTVSQKNFPKVGHLLYESDEAVEWLLRKAGFKAVTFAIKGPSETAQGRLALASA